jgi:hypothetical protein
LVDISASCGYFIACAGGRVAKVRRCKLSWKPSDSDRVIGYKLYWSRGKMVDYDSNFFELGNINEVYLPDVLKLDARYDVRVKLGVTAVDMNGNESDMVLLAAPYQTFAPPAPAELALTTLEEFCVINAAAEEASDQFDTLFQEDAGQRFAGKADSPPGSRPADGRVASNDDRSPPEQ